MEEQSQVRENVLLLIFIWEPPLVQLPAGEIKSLVQRVCLDDGQKTEVVHSKRSWRVLDQHQAVPAYHTVQAGSSTWENVARDTPGTGSREPWLHLFPLSLEI